MRVLEPGVGPPLDGIWVKLEGVSDEKAEPEKITPSHADFGAEVRLEDRPNGVAVMCQRCGAVIGTAQSKRTAYFNADRWAAHVCKELD